ncbi:MAG: MarR family transcriptional regulator [Coriobacteriaceae bacterium]|nr:MarR family transcriptional regulator [Coriobacteriaceae bacterium]
MSDKYASLRLESQLCFPLYAASKEIVRRYKPLLDPLDLTYTQYITMMALWEHEQMSVSELGECLYLNSATLTPVLKRLEAKGFITRKRSLEDERSVIVGITDEGRKLQDQALSVPVQMGSCVRMDPQEAYALKQLLDKLLASFDEE